jgi:hypothetical protein
MSPIASAYVVTGELLALLARLAAKRDPTDFWQALHSSAAEVQPDFPYSGYVLAVVIAYLEEQQEWPLSLDLQSSSAKAIADAGFSLVLCVERDDALAWVTSLDTFAPYEKELHQFYEEFNEEEWDEAGTAMLEGLAFLKRAFIQLRNGGDWLLLFIG